MLGSFYLQLRNSEFGQRIVRLGVSYTSFCHIMCMLMMYYHGEVMLQELSADAVRHPINHAGVGRLDLTGERARP